MSITTFPAKIADLEFTMNVPDGFAQPPFPEEEPDFSDTTKMCPLALLASPVAAAIITVSARPAYGDGTVMHWLTYLAAHFEITLTALTPGKVSSHPAILAEGHQVQDGMTLKMLFAALEDGGRLVLVHTLCPAELWPSFERPMRDAIGSFALARPKGPTAPLAPEPAAIAQP